MPIQSQGSALIIMVHNLFTQNICEIKISYSNKIPFKDRISVTSSSQCYALLSPLWPNIDHLESFYAIMLNRANKVLGISLISTGGVAGCVVDPKVIFQHALKANASSIILAHNHPSGNDQPSDPDRKLTEKLKAAGKVLDIQVLDHIILTAENYFSFADEGIF